jgi:hypothetical protein
MYKINSWALIITVLLCFTFWGGIIALPVLGLLQIIISIKIISLFKNLTEINQSLFVIYILVTITIIICLKYSNIDAMLAMFIWAIASIFLAGFHVYLTYRISKS